MKIKLKDIKPNPNNPRILKDWQYDKLKKSIQDFPEMLELRPIVIDENNTILGGNMRFKVLKDLGYKEIEVVKAKDLTEDQKKEFIIKDNLSFGEWDSDILANEWDGVKLEEWGFNINSVITEPESKEKTEILKPYNKAHILITYPPDMYDEIKQRIDEIINLAGIEIETSAN